MATCGALVILVGCGTSGPDTGTDFGGSMPESTLDLILFSSTRDYNSELYYMNPDGSGQTRLTYVISSETDPCWSPDGTQIAFVSNRTGNFEIWRMNTDGTNAARLTDHGAEDLEPAWSPDGLRIAFKSNRDHELYEIYTMSAIDGSDVRRITENEQSDNSPSWSPDGRRLVMSRVTPVGISLVYSSGDLVIADAGGSGTETQLTQHQEGEMAQTPSWGMSGGEEWILYAYRPNPDVDTDIWRMRPDGTGRTQLTTDAASSAAPSFSRDGSRIVFHKFVRGTFDVFAMDFDGANEVQLTTSEEADTNPVCSPAGP